MIRTSFAVRAALAAACCLALCALLPSSTSHAMPIFGVGLKQIENPELFAVLDPAEQQFDDTILTPGSTVVVFKEILVPPDFGPAEALHLLIVAGKDVFHIGWLLEGTVLTGFDDFGFSNASISATIPVGGQLMTKAGDVPIELRDAGVDAVPAGVRDAFLAELNNPDAFGLGRGPLTVGSGGQVPFMTIHVPAPAPLGGLAIGWLAVLLLARRRR